jgi:sugar lactone lactonase YvrE
MNRIQRLAALAGFSCLLAGCPDPCLAPGSICAIAGTGTDGFNGDGKAALETDLYFPVDVTIGPDERVYIVDWNNHRIRRIEETGTVTTVVGTGIIGDEVSGDASSLNHPTNVLFDSQGRMLIAAWHNSKIKRLDLVTGVLEDLCGSGKRAYSGDGGPAKTADLDLPAGIAFARDGSLFVMDQANQVIRRVRTDDVIERYAGRCVVGEPVEGVTPFACPNTNKVTYIPESEEDRCARPCVAGFGGDGGPALDARIGQPVGQSADPAGRMAIDPDGLLVFADTRNHRIRRVDARGVITTIAGSGEPGVGADGLAATATDLDSPADVAFGPDGTLYVADTLNSCVRAVGADGIARVVAGQCGVRTKKGVPLGDAGPATKATLDRPYGITVDSRGNLYIADTQNSLLRRVAR